MPCSNMGYTFTRETAELDYSCDQVKEISFEVRMETIFMLMISAVLLSYF